jgi:hypothetical protein
MANINPTDSLQLAITELEIRRENELVVLKEQISAVHESLKPVNLIKSVIKDTTESPELKGGLTNAAIGLSVGFLLRKLLFRQTNNPIKNIMGNILQSIVSNIAARNADKIKAAGKFVYSKIAHQKDINEAHLN